MSPICSFPNSVVDRFVCNGVLFVAPSNVRAYSKLLGLVVKVGNTYRFDTVSYFAIRAFLKDLEYHVTAISHRVVLRSFESQVLLCSIFKYEAKTKEQKHHIEVLYTRHAKLLRLIRSNSVYFQHFGYFVTGCEIERCRYILVSNHKICLTHIQGINLDVWNSVASLDFIERNYRFNFF